MRKIFVFAIGTIFFVMLFAGCEQQQVQTSADSRKSRLVSAENIELKKQLQQCSNKLEKCENRLRECQLETEASIKKTTEDADSLIRFVMDEMEKLMKENTELKSKVEKLEKQ